MKLMIGILAAWAVVVGLVVPMSAVQSDEHRMIALSVGTQMDGATIPLCGTPTRC